MGDADKNFRIKLTTVADTSGVKQTTQSVDKLKVSMDGLSQAGGVFKKSSDVVEQGHNKAGHAAEKSSESHRGMNAVFRLLGRETVPELGHALHGLEFAPEIAGALALGYALEFVTAKLTEQKKALEDVQAAATQLDIDIWHQQRDAIKSAADAADDYAAKMSAIPDAIHKVTAAETEQLAVLHEKLTAQQKILAAEEQAESARAASPEQKAEIEARYGHRRTAAELSGEQSTIDVIQSQAAAHATAAGGLKAKADADETAREQAITDAKAAADKAKADAAVKERDDLKKQVDTAVKTFGPNSSEASVREEAANAVASGEASEPAFNTNELFKKFDDANDKVAALDKANKDAAQSLKDATAKAEASAKAYDENKAELEKLNTSIKGLTDALTIHQDTARSSSVLDFTKPGAVDNVMTGAIQAFTDARAGKMTDADRNAMENLKSLFDTLGWNSKTVIGMINSHTDIAKGVKDIAQAAHTRIDSLAREIGLINSRAIHDYGNIHH